VLQLPVPARDEVDDEAGGGERRRWPLGGRLMASQARVRRECEGPGAKQSATGAIETVGGGAVVGILRWWRREGAVIACLDEMDRRLEPGHGARQREQQEQCMQQLARTQPIQWNAMHPQHLESQAALDAANHVRDEPKA